MGTNRINIRFPDESSLQTAMSRTTAFHSKDGRPLYKDNIGKVHDPIGDMKALLDGLSVYSRDEIDEMISRVDVSEFYTKAEVDSKVELMMNLYDEINSELSISQTKVLEMQDKVELMELISFLNRTGLGFYSVFDSTEGINTTGTTATLQDGAVSFGDTVQVLRLEEQTFEDFTGIEIALYERGREELSSTFDVTNTDIIDLECSPGYLQEGQRIYVNGEVLDIMEVVPL